jgi:glycosyltransferase involved in cell wall biosynthesis
VTERRHSVSFVLPAYNEEANVVEAIQRVSSVGDRLFADHEIVLVDDGSTDNTAKLVEGLASGDPRVRLSLDPPNCPV